MNRYFHPYYFMGLVAVSFSMLFLFKINKVSFYHHYFKVIEEVEIRNSQELASASLGIFSTTTDFRQWIQPLLSLLSGLAGVSLLVIAILHILSWPPVRPHLSYHRVFASLPPVRAP